MVTFSETLNNLENIHQLYKVMTEMITNAYQAVLENNDNCLYLSLPVNKKDLDETLNYSQEKSFFIGTPNSIDL